MIPLGKVEGGGRRDITVGKRTAFGEIETSTTNRTVLGAEPRSINHFAKIMM